MIGDEMNAESSAKIDTGLACFAIMANYFEKPLSLEQVKHKYDRQNSDFEEYELLQLAKEFSFKAKFVKTAPDRLEKTNLPAIAQDKDNRYFIIGKIADGKVLVQDPAAGNHPQVWSEEQLLQRWNGRLLMMTCREFINGKNRKFDISWFIPAIVKYRRLFGEVILASFFFTAVCPCFSVAFSGRHRQGFGKPRPLQPRRPYGSVNLHRRF